MPIAIPTFIEKEPVVRPDLLAETPDPKTDVTAAEWNEVTSLIVEIAETLNAGGTATPSDDDPEDVTNAVADPGAAADYARIDHVHQLGTLTGTDFADPVLQTASPDQGGLGVALTPSGLTGPVDMGIGPTIPASGPGKGLVITAGVGAANEDGGTLTLDAGPSNGGGSVAGNVKIGRDSAVEVLIGLEGVGSPITLEGQVTTIGHVPTAPADVLTLGTRSAAAIATHSAGTLSLLATHEVVLLDNSAGALSVQLPNPATVGARSWRLKITSDSKNPVSLLRNAAETIEGYAATKVLRAPHGSWELICDGTSWRLLGKNRLDLIYTASDTLTVQAGWVSADVGLRAGAGAGGAGGTGGAGASAGTGGGGGGRGGAAGGSATRLTRALILPAPGTVLTLTVGAGGVGGAGSGPAGSATEILDGATLRLRAARTNPPEGGSGGVVGGTGGAGVGATGGAAGGTSAAGVMTPSWGGISGPASAPGVGGSGVAGANGTNTSVSTATRPGPWAATFTSTGVSGTGGALGGGTHGGGGGGSGGGASATGDEFSAAGLACGADDGAGGRRTTTEGNGGAGNAAGAGSPGFAGAAGYAGTNGRGGGGGQGGGGGGAGSTTGGAGGVGGNGGSGSNGEILFTVWE